MDITIVESPYDSGYLARRMGAGPAHLIRSGLVERLEAEAHDVDLVRLDLGPGLHGEIGAAVELMRRISETVNDAVERNRSPVVLSGNCYAAVGAVSGIGAEETGVIWYDAHGDLNTPDTTRSGFFDGLSLDELEATIAAVGRGAPVAGVGFASYDPEADQRNAGPRVVGRILNALLGEFASGETSARRSEP